MIQFEHFQLHNGLEVYILPDRSTPMAAVNLLYKVGAKNEHSDKTGFAHLFEHLMFGGSANIPEYDTVLQKVGGENNAFTSNDITNYYITLPAINLETALWLESDRMMSLSFDEKVLELQKKVVIEEFKQRYLNQPYGDIWLKLRPLAYKIHPYQWATIGKDISHIEQASLEDVKDFFFRFYRPNNAILCIAGNVEVKETLELVKKWFGEIPSGNVPVPNLPKEPEQKEERKLEVESKVPLSAIYKCYHSPARTSPDFYPADLLGDILGRGKSARLYRNLVKENKIFNDVSSFVMGAVDTDLFIVGGKLNHDVSLEEGEKALINSLEEVHEITETELEKVKNQSESSLLLSSIELLNRAMSVCIYASMGDVQKVNRQSEYIQSVQLKDVQRLAKEILKPANCSTLLYQSIPS